ncbi:ABC transporter ATP-binding protein [Psychroflexus maritimus]|uniref:ABC transporter ATP-binding protein n=1 Tax=Psychroflexus maritimus TaxID=2714865 RepID=A0A967AAW3_9FLAO|nr:ABC transporter ATP-binding protein [Psychroflexus maritimus]NGZ88862.1 ABC transporter ATP-binding protein [Psychroflexus maritimus]
MGELAYLNKFFVKYKWHLILGFIITVGARVFTLVTPKFIGESTNVIEAYINGEVTDYQAVKDELLINIFIIIGAATLSAILTFLMRQTFIVASRKIEFDLKNEIYQQYQRLSLNFYKKNRTGDLMNRISEDVSKVRMYVGPALMYGVMTLTLFVVAISYMLYIAPVLTLYVMLPFPILSFAIYKLSVAINQRSTVVQQVLSKLNSFTQESFSGIAVVKSYGTEALVNEDFVHLSNESKSKNIDLVRVQAFFFPLMILLIGCSNLLVLYIGGTRYFNGEIENLGTIVEFLLYVNMLTWPVASVGWITSMVQQASASQKRINEFLSAQPEIQNHSNLVQEINGEIEFKNVSFTYDDTGIQALKGVSFKLKRGENLVIIGKTGSGKSTLLELISRLYDVQSGEILIDGQKIDSINLNLLRESIGYVPQDSFLFSESIADNIKFGDADATQEKIEEAAKNAAVHENILNFKEAYNTVLGERGITLSGGQKQRISIARAIIRKPKIVLFDDCLSAVDTETEEAIFQKLEEISANRTAVIVSHRVSSARNADQVIVLDEGIIIQQGKHEVLIEADGYYKKLYQEQLTEK